MKNSLNRWEATVWLVDNILYCEDAHSFVHRLYDEFKRQKPQSYREAQFIASKVLTELYEVFEFQCKEGKK